MNARARRPLSRVSLILALLLVSIINGTANVWQSPTSAVSNAAKFGHAAAVSGDITVVGAYEEGAVYVYRRTAAGSAQWSLQQRLVPTGGSAGDFFGWSVAVAGGDIVIGAINDDSAATDAGAVYVFAESNGSWSQSAKLTAADGGLWDNLGSSVAVDGGVIVAGAKFHDDALRGEDCGAAYVFRKAGANWSQESKLLPSQAKPGDGVGSAVTISTDRIALGAPGSDVNGQSNQGGVYLYQLQGGAWTMTAFRSTGKGGDSFGSALAMRGEELLVGAWLADGAGKDTGAAYWFRGGADPVVIASPEGANGWFGRAVALQEEWMIISVPGVVNAGSGRVHCYRREAAGINPWVLKHQITFGGDVTQRRLGWSMGMSEDVCVVGNTGAVHWSRELSPPILSFAGQQPITVTECDAIELAFSVRNEASRMTATGVPSGLVARLNAPGVGGVISGRVGAPGSYDIILTASNDCGAGEPLSLRVVVQGAPPLFIANAIPDGANPCDHIVNELTLAATELKPLEPPYVIKTTRAASNFQAPELTALGLRIDSATGAISGAPMLPGQHRITVTVRNDQGERSIPLTINVQGVAPVITSPLNANGTELRAFSYQITATSRPTSFGATGLPEGLAINATTGLISGTPTLPGTYTVGLSASNAIGVGRADLQLAVAGVAPVITSPLTATGDERVAFTYQITATSRPTEFNAVGLPPGMEVNRATGLISGTPSEAGAYSVALSARNAFGVGEATAVLTIRRGAPVITSQLAVNGQAQQTFRYQITATSSPTSFDAAGLPAGLQLDKRSGVISGQAPGGVHRIELSASNEVGTGKATLTLTVPETAPVITNCGAVDNILFRRAVFGATISFQIETNVSVAEYFVTGGRIRGFNDQGLRDITAQELGGRTVLGFLGLQLTAQGLITGSPDGVLAFEIILGARNSAGEDRKTLQVLLNEELSVAPGQSKVTAFEGDTTFSFLFDPPNRALRWREITVTQIEGTGPNGQKIAIPNLGAFNLQLANEAITLLPQVTLRIPPNFPESNQDDTFIISVQLADGCDSANTKLELTIKEKPGAAGLKLAPLREVGAVNIKPNASGGISIDWRSADGVSYEIQYSPSLEPESWRGVGVVLGNGSQMRYLPPIQGPSERRCYYRVLERAK